MLNKIIAEVEALKVDCISEEKELYIRTHAPAYIEKVLEILKRYKVNEDNLLRGIGK